MRKINKIKNNCTKCSIFFALELITKFEQLKNITILRKFHRTLLLQFLLIFLGKSCNIFEREKKASTEKWRHARRVSDWRNDFNELMEAYRYLRRRYADK